MPFENWSDVRCTICGKLYRIERIDEKEWITDYSGAWFVGDPCTGCGEPLSYNTLVLAKDWEVPGDEGHWEPRPMYGESAMARGQRG